MSLYIYGILAPPMRRTEEQRAEFVELARRLHIVISLDSLDEEDEECLLAIAPEAKGGLKFALCNEGGGATAIWIEAMLSAREAAREALRDATVLRFEDIRAKPFSEQYFEIVGGTRLGQIVRNIVEGVNTSGGVMALVDGGIEGAYYGQRHDVVREILKTCVLSWDCIPNWAYRWGP
jgi:hypothetical protein